VTDTLELKRGDTAPAVQAPLYADDAATTPLDLAGATVEFVMAKTASEPGTPKLTGACTVTDPTAGKVEYGWQAGDTDTAGSYMAEFQITWSDGTIQTLPRSGYLTVTITEDLD
jgi:hypothetical protein